VNTVLRVLHLASVCIVHIRIKTVGSLMRTQMCIGEYNLEDLRCGMKNGVIQS